MQITQKIIAADVLTDTPTPVQQPKPAAPTERPELLYGTTYKLKTPLSPHALYITVNDIDTPDGRRPFELFINSKAMAQFHWIVALTRLCSAVFRHAAQTGADATFVVEELRSVFDPSGGYFKRGIYTPSLVAEIGGVIDRHMQSLGLRDAPVAPADYPETAALCGKCMHKAVVVDGGCEKCLACGDSRCG